jgi:hypothetical protein
MSGAYPDPPSYRMAYHRDGTQIIVVPTGLNLSQTNLNTLNSEAGNTTVTSSQVCVIFPELRDLDAIWLNGNTGSIATSVSVDSTNGLDGTWTAGPTVPVVADGGNPLGAGWRNSIASSTTFGIKAVRFTVTNLRNIHLYGEIAPTETEKRIEFWHPTIDQKISPGDFDWGNCPRQSSGQTSFRLKNMSPVLTAFNVIVSALALTDTTPSVPAQHFLSSDTAHWAATVDAGAIASDGMSPILYLRRVTPSDAVLTTPRWAFHLIAVPTLWS